MSFPTPAQRALGLTLLTSLFTACGDKAAADLSEESLGTFTTDTGGLTGPVPFTVPDGAASALIWCGAYGSSKLGTAYTITDQAGSVAYTYEDGGTGIRADVHDDLVPLLLPMSPDKDLAAGDWSVDIFVATEDGAVKNQSVDCTALYRIVDPGSSATVDLHIILVGVSGLDAAGAADDANMQAVLDGVDALWSTAGLSVGEVSFEDFSGDVDKYTVLDAQTEFNSLLETVSLPSPKVLPIFLVDEITDSGSTTLGKAAGPPGLATISGTSKSGMVASAADLEGDPDKTARIIAHEGGHFLGLFHPTEKDGSEYDPISDTAKCTTDSDGDGVYAPTECASSGADNLMFWAESSSMNGLSADQGWVLVRNPVSR
jgi:hypothetical protein